MTLSKDQEDLDEARAMADEPEDPPEDYAECICSGCNGSGEGMYEGTVCRTCKGKGEI